MKILLLEHPRRIAKERCNDIANAPLSSSLITGYTAGMLESRGHEVKIVEGYLDRLSYGEIYESISVFGPEILGVHMVYSWGHNEELFSLLKQVKGEGINRIVAYGFYPTFAYREILQQCREIDAVIIGEPEHTFAQLAGKGQNNSEFRSIAGLAWKEEGGGIRLTRREPMENLDLLPSPVYTEALLRLPEINVEGSRGCYGGCTFCYINPYYGKPSCWRGKSPEKVAGEIDSLIDRYGKRNFYFVDPNFFGPGQYGQERVLRLASLLKERGICFGVEGRVNDIHEETISALVDAGLYQILIGLESGRNESLKRLNKMTTVEQNERAIRILRKYGIEPNIGFIMFEPDSSLEDIRTNLQFLQRNELLNRLSITANVLYHSQIILQGTKAYQSLLSQGRLKLLSTAYEGTASFADPQVATLAQVVGKITNYLFLKLDEIWSGRVEEPKNAETAYRKLNRSLIDYFTNTLTDLELGKTFTDEDIRQLTADAEKEINCILG